MKTKEIVNCIKKDYEKLKSVKNIYENKDGGISIECVRYKGYDGQPTSSQIDYLAELVDYDSRSNLRKLNKWCVSAAIDIAKKFPDIRFYVYC